MLDDVNSRWTVPRFAHPANAGWWLDSSVADRMSAMGAEMSELLMRCIALNNEACYETSSRSLQSAAGHLPPGAPSVDETGRLATREIVAVGEALENLLFLLAAATRFATEPLEALPRSVDLALFGGYLRREPSSERRPEPERLWMEARESLEKAARLAPSLASVLRDQNRPALDRVIDPLERLASVVADPAPADLV